MKKLHKLIISSWFGPFIMTFFISLFILLMQFLWKYIDELVGKGLEWYVILELLFYASASLVPLALPLAILLSSIMTFGSLGEHYELVALKSSGVSLWRIMMPLIIMSVVLSIGAFYFSNNVLPVAKLKMGTLLYDIRQKRPALNIQEGIFYAGIENFSIRVEKKSEDGQHLEKFMIYDHSERKGNNKVIVAESGTMKTSDDERYLILTLFNGHSYEEQERPRRKRDNSYPHVHSSFAVEVIRFDLSGFQLSRSDEEIFKNNYQMMNVRQILQQHDTLTQRLEERKASLSDNLKRNLRYFNTEYIRESAPDSIRQQAKVQPYKTADIHPDSDILKNFDKKEQMRILDAAMSSARSNKAYVSSYSSDFKNREKNIKRHMIEFHRKFTLSFACMVMFFIGAPLGAIIRKGGLGLPTVISVLFFVMYYVVSITGEKFAREGVWAPHEGMWMSSAILLPVGVFLTYKATTDSSIFIPDAYLKPFKSIAAIFRKKKSE